MIDEVLDNAELLADANPSWEWYVFPYWGTSDMIRNHWWMIDGFNECYGSQAPLWITITIWCTVYEINNRITIIYE